MTLAESPIKNRRSGIAKLDIVIIVLGVAATAWFAFDLMRATPAVAPSAAKDRNPSAPVSRRPASQALPTAPPGRIPFAPGSPAPGENAPKPYAGSLAIDPFAEGGPAVIAVHPEPPSITGPIEERDEEVLKGTGQ
jgi:hypothetical protein